MLITDTTPEPAGVFALAELLDRRRVVVLAGAGCSTESGIPDYRGPAGRARTRTPMQYQEFVRSADARVRYWARSAAGWARFSGARPNPGHRALARLEGRGVVRGIITQNVDGLHHAAGSRAVVELHGSLARVRCLDCGDAVDRDAVQARILALNSAWSERLRRSLEDGAAAMAPDGDVELPDSALEHFRVPACEGCEGVLKPDVVFFGENVPRPRVEEAWRLFDAAEVLLVAGSSLAVWSGRRFVDRARKQGVPIAIINVGPTRADDAAAVKVEGRLGRVLPRLATALLAGRRAAGS